MKRTYSQVVKLESIEIGQIVFAKVKFFPPWPAIITFVAGIKYDIRYYGEAAQT